jgi:hypothetical protein
LAWGAAGGQGAEGAIVGGDDGAGVVGHRWQRKRERRRRLGLDLAAAARWRGSDGLGFWLG